MIRVGAVSYLNARPLYHRLDEFAPGVKLDLDVPSALADRLGRGELDVALVPSIEAIRGLERGFEILPGFAIAARAAVRSVKLFCRVPFRLIQRLALDDGSRTSQVLARVWLDAEHGVRPERIERLPLGVSPLESEADAVLVIGDRCMRVPNGPFAAVVDLAEAWNHLTGLPFVFALWVARPAIDLGDLPAALEKSRAAGLAEAAAIARLHAPRLKLDEAECLDYLTRVLSYDLGPAEVAGLELFACRAAALGLAPRGASLVFHRPEQHRHRLDPASRRRG
jgi:chorismate dehydratase